MPINTSIYQNAQPVQMPSIADSMQKALTLSNMGLENQQSQYKMQGQQAMRQAFADNTDASGNLNRQGALSQIARVSPQLAMQLGQSFTATDKAKAEAQGAQADAASKTYNITGPAFDHLASMPEDQRAAAYPGVIQQLKDQGIDVSKMDHPYDPNLFGQYYNNWIGSKESLANQAAQANIKKTYADIGLVPLQKQNEQFGTRSASHELSSQYDKDVAPIKGSQIAMRQMMDNYSHPSPQGDASLILNAFRIKFPNAPDVNSLEELSKAQGVPDQWKNAAYKALQGGLDQPTRDNLMRDGISTYRANYGTYQDVAKKYQQMAKERGINPAGMTTEPALDSTFSNAMDLQKKIGPYVPPAQRSGSVLGSIGNMLGMGGPKNANAAQPQIKHGTVEDGYVFMGGDPGNPKSWMRQK